MNTHTKKISRLFNIEIDVDEHILNLSSFIFFQKLVLCRGLKIAILSRVSAIDAKENFKKRLLELLNPTSIMII